LSESIRAPGAHITAAATTAAPTALSVTVVIPTRNRGALIEETLEALTQLRTGDPEFEILVVDQSTDDATQQVVAQFIVANETIRYHSSHTVGSSANRNLGAQLSTSDIVAYVDDDCIVDANYVMALRAVFANPEVAAVYGRLEPYERGRTGRDVGLKDSDERCVYAGRVPPWYIGHGGNMAFRRADLLEVGGFDPLLSAGGLLRSNEDGDISYRFLAAGKRVAYEPDMLAYHKHWKDWRAQAMMERAYGIGAGGQFAKYIRCGDTYGWHLLGIWVWQLGVRRVGAGMFKWRSFKTMYLGYCQLIYPWLGIWKSLRYDVDARHLCYRDPSQTESTC
jgi:glycosyltransferase involved in cell wall biosynthesis